MGQDKDRDQGPDKGRVQGRKRLKALRALLTRPAEFSDWRRQRMSLPRGILFAIVGVGFVLASLQNHLLFKLTPEIQPLFHLIELLLAAPLLFLAAAASWSHFNRRLVNAIQTGAGLFAISATIVLRYLALAEGVQYPAHMGGIILVALAMFGGFNWERITLMAVAYFAGASAVEFAMAPAGHNAAVEVYANLFFMVIAAAGSITHELLMRVVWNELMRIRAMRAELHNNEERFTAFMDNNPAIAWMKDEQGRYLYGNRAFQKFLGVKDQSWRGKTDADYFSPEFAKRSQELERAVLIAGTPTEVIGVANGASGGTRHWSLVRFPFSDSAGRRMIGGVATDITEKKRAENLVRLQALTDELTGLYNRRGFSAAAEDGMSAARDAGKRCGLIYVDLDNLKTINQVHGHAGGDTAIMSVGEALRIACNVDDIIGRVGGDEFLVFTTECNTLAGLNTRISEAVASYSNSAATPFKLSATIGIWEFDPGSGVSLDEQIRQADELMFENKKWKKKQSPSSGNKQGGNP